MKLRFLYFAIWQPSTLYITCDEADVGAPLVCEGGAGVGVTLVVQEHEVVLHRPQVDHLRLLVTLHTTGSLNCG